MIRKAAVISLSAVLLIGAFGSVGADAKKKKKAAVTVTAVFTDNGVGATFDRISGTISSKKAGCLQTNVEIYIEIGATDALLETASTDPDNPDGNWSTSIPAGAPSGTQFYAVTPQQKIYKEGVSPLVTVP